VDADEREWEDSWASAAGAGESVAMPSGYGPSREHHPGWVTEISDD
jgi:hypothetical protein